MSLLSVKTISTALRISGGYAKHRLAKYKGIKKSSRTHNTKSEHQGLRVAAIKALKHQGVKVLKHLNIISK